MVVANKPISRTEPVIPAALMVSPTLNGRSTIRNTPAAKFESNPDQAIPIATPVAARRADRDVVSIPKTPRIAKIKNAFKTKADVAFA